MGSLTSRIDNESILTRRWNEKPQISLLRHSLRQQNFDADALCECGTNSTLYIRYINICGLVSLEHSSPPLCLFAGFVWVVVGGLHRAQGVVDYPVVRLVRPYRQHHVPHGRVILETKSVRIYGPLTPTCARTITFTVIFKIGCMVPYRPIHTQLFSDYYWEGNGT